MAKAKDMTESALAIYEEWLDAADGNYQQALWYASMEIASMSRSISAGYVRAKPVDPPKPKPRKPVVDDGEAWLKTGVTNED